jgi:hypothetical protein
VTEISVRGNATAEELAAVLAVVACSEPTRTPDSYTRWRAIRLAALHRSEPTSPRTG